MAKSIYNVKEKVHSDEIEFNAGFRSTYIRENAS